MKNDINKKDKEREDRKLRLPLFGLNLLIKRYWKAKNALQATQKRQNCLVFFAQILVN
jgi:hypothetical protein